MNAARIAALLRELADALDGEGEEEPSAPRTPRRKPRRMVAPRTEVTDIERARAARRMREW